MEALLALIVPGAVLLTDAVVVASVVAVAMVAISVAMEIAATVRDCVGRLLGLDNN